MVRIARVKKIVFVVIFRHSLDISSFLLTQFQHKINLAVSFLIDSGYTDTIVVDFGGSRFRRW